MKNWQIWFVGCVSLLLFGCATGGSSNQANAIKAEPEKSRAQLQFQLGQLSDVVWLRTGDIIFVDSNLPLTSDNPITQANIKTDLRYQIHLAQKRLDEVNRRVQMRYQQDEVLDLLTINLIGLELNGTDFSINYLEQSIVLVKGEMKVWNLALGDNSQRSIKLVLVYSETGELFIEGQGVLTVSPWMSKEPFLTSVHWFEQSVRSQGRLNLTLQPSLGDQN